MPALYIIPLTVIPLIIFDIVGLIFGGTVWDSQVFAITMVSGPTSVWVFTLGHLLLLGGIGCLFFEVLKSTNSSSRAITNHILSTVVVVIYLLEFIFAGIAANSTFFFLMIFALFDVIAGFSITIKTASRDVTYSRSLETPP